MLLKTVEFIQHYVHIAADRTPLHFGYMVFPALGMLISLLLVRYVIKDRIGHGVTKVLLAVSRSESRIKPHNMWSSLLTSAITIGCGGSVGAEAPIVYTGAAMGSNLGKAFKLSHRGITILLGCGAAGAIAGIFKAPLAGVLFTLEILLFNISMSSMMPLLLSTVTATVVSMLFLGNHAPFACVLVPFDMGNLPFYVVLGVFCGIFSLYFTHFTLWLEDKIGKNLRSRYVRWMACSLGLGLLIMLFPPLFGEGYDSLGALLSGEDVSLKSGTPLGFLMQSPWSLPIFFLLVLLLKVVSMTLTNSGGGVGGTFGPTLFEGAIVGFIVSRSFNLCGLALPEQNFVLVGMAGLMAGVMQAPMTAIFLIAEITGGYGLLLPLILCATVSYGVTRTREKYSIYTKRIAQSGDLLTHDNDQSALAMMNLSELVRDKYPHLSSGRMLGEIRDVIAESTAAVFPVLDDAGKFEGMVEMDDIRKYLFDAGSMQSLSVSDVMHAPPVYIYADEKPDSVMLKFDRTGAWRLPVIDRDGVYKGFISRSRILMAYRKELKQLTED